MIANIMSKKNNIFRIMSEFLRNFNEGKALLVIEYFEIALLGIVATSFF